MKQPIIKQIYEVYERWLDGNKIDKDFYEMYIGLVLENTPREQHKGFYIYWESLKKNSKLENAVDLK